MQYNCLSIHLGSFVSPSRAGHSYPGTYSRIVRVAFAVQYGVEYVATPVQSSVWLCKKHLIFVLIVLGFSRKSAEFGKIPYCPLNAYYLLFMNYTILIPHCGCINYHIVVLYAM